VVKNSSSSAGIEQVQSNNSFKPNLLRYTKHMAEKACHVFGSTTQVGLTQALDKKGKIMSIVKEREKLALDAIKKVFGTEAGEDSVNLFVEHHLAELPQNYWVQHLGSESPEASAVINLLELNSSWGDGEIENFDFTLPGDVTDYMVSVHFDESGNIDEISMES
jgi:hypothetical protein